MTSDKTPMKRPGEVPAETSSDDEVTDSLERGDAAAELLTVVAVGDGEIHAAFHGADELGRSGERAAQDELFSAHGCDLETASVRYTPTLSLDV